ncbi:AurF N-oxygenase family protein [Streptomyces sp. cmx-4-9]|uniref:AurF N-oxygenase family protein n=1 Tax=Streptomyces sp. cmx-4-9 TaxID=2790941 RepID=UPI0039806175
MGTHPTAAPAEGTSHEVARRLLQVSPPPLDSQASIAWDSPAPDDVWYCVPERMPLFGTPLWQRMDDKQRLEMSRRELANMVGLALWSELLLMETFARALTRRDPRDPRTQYALTEISEEARHSAMFSQLLDRLGCPDYRPSAALHRAAVCFLPSRHDLRFATPLIFEEVLDRFQREAARDERVHPLVRQVCRIHVADEARHITFARSAMRDSVRCMPPARLAVQRQRMGVRAMAVTKLLVNPRVFRDMGLDPRQARSEARANAHFQGTLLWSGAKVVPFLTDIGMITSTEKLWWRHAGLLQ